jgi:hypothetical protein
VRWRTHRFHIEQEPYARNINVFNAGDDADLQPIKPHRGNLPWISRTSLAGSPEKDVPLAKTLRFL